MQHISQHLRYVQTKIFPRQFKSQLLFRLKLATAAKFAHLDGTLLGFNARLDQTGHDFGQYLETIGANVQALSASVSSLIDRVTALEEHTGSHAPLIGNHHGDHHHA